MYVAQQPAYDGDRLPANLLHFVRLLRQLGFRVGAAQMADMLRGLSLIDVSDRYDFYCVTRSCLVNQSDQIPLFDRAFQLFWLGREQWLLEIGQADFRDPVTLDQPALRTAHTAPHDRLADRYSPPEDDDQPAPDSTDLTATYSPWETLRHKDFAAMSAAEIGLARRWLDDLMWRIGQRRTRRCIRAHKRTGCLDLSATVRSAMKHQGEIVQLVWSRPRFKPRPLVVVCDISGSMERYARLFLHFIYAVRQSAQQLEAFVFGTRLTRITPALRHNDVDAALTDVTKVVMDWSGGTRIGESLRSFNYQWSRRVLRNSAAVIIISDGWDRGDTDMLGTEMARLHRSCYRLIWLNPLAGAPGYAPLVRGMQAALPHIDDFLPLHNLDSLEQIAMHLSVLSQRGRASVAV